MVLTAGLDKGIPALFSLLSMPWPACTESREFEEVSSRREVLIYSNSTSNCDPRLYFISLKINTIYVNILLFKLLILS